MKRFLPALFSVWITVFLLSSAAQAMELSLNVHTGEKYTMHIQEAFQMNMLTANRTIEIKSFSDLNLHMNVLGVDKDQNATIQFRFDSIQLADTAPGTELAYDSVQSTPSGPYHAILTNFIGKSFTAKIDKKGHILELHGVDAILNGIMDSQPSDEQQKQALQKIIAEELSDKALKSMLKNSLDYFPDKSIRSGDTWESKETSIKLGPTTTTNTKKLIGEQNGILRVEVSENTESTPDVGSTKLKLLNANGSGSLAVNKHTGLVQSGNEVVNIDGEMEINDPQKAEKIIIPIRVTGKATWEFKKL